MAPDRERIVWWLSLASLPLLVAAAFAANSWRNIEDYSHRVEVNVEQNSDSLDYAGANWKLYTVRLIGDGQDTALRFPGQMRLVIVRLVATARSEIGQRWSQCQMTLTDDRGHRWLPLDVTMSDNISHDLDPKATPVSGCGIASLSPPQEGRAVLIEEKYVVPADAARALAVRLSFASERPGAISIPLGLN
jgi:hypothetical protein